MIRKIGWAVMKVLALFVAWLILRQRAVPVPEPSLIQDV